MTGFYFCWLFASVTVFSALLSVIRSLDSIWVWTYNPLFPSSSFSINFTAMTFYCFETYGDWNKTAAAVNVNINKNRICLALLILYLSHSCICSGIESFIQRLKPLLQATQVWLWSFDACRPPFGKYCCNCPLSGLSHLPTNEHLTSTKWNSRKKTFHYLFWRSACKPLFVTN